MPLAIIFAVAGLVAGVFRVRTPQNRETDIALVGFVVVLYMLSFFTTIMIATTRVYFPMLQGFYSQYWYWQHVA